MSWDFNSQASRRLDFADLVSSQIVYDNHRRAHASRDHLPPIRKVSRDVASLSVDQVAARVQGGGLVKSIRRMA
jgi:hypothetical protein